MGESPKDRVDLAFDLKRLEVDCVPLNVLNPRRGTPLGDVEPVTQVPSTRLDTVPLVEVMARIRTTIERTRPAVVYMPSPWDVHTDHRITFEAALSVLKPFHMPRLGVQRVLAFETPSSTDAAPALPHRLFVPTVFVDVGAFLERKLEISSLFASEVQAEPLPRSASAVRALARVRGATIAAEYAEAFTLIRELS
jgi:LmbE family N-acetylglucosaminyl deacetylase